MGERGGDPIPADLLFPHATPRLDDFRIGHDGALDHHMYEGNPGAPNDQ